MNDFCDMCNCLRLTLVYRLTVVNKSDICTFLVLLS